MTRLQCGYSQTGILKIWKIVETLKPNYVEFAKRAQIIILPHNWIVKKLQSLSSFAPGNCWVLETDHVCGEISVHIFAPRLLFTYSALAYANYLSFHQRALKESGNVPCLYFFPKKFSIINWVDNVDWPPLGVEADRGVESGRTRGERGREAGEEIEKALVFGLFTAYQPIKNQYPETFFDFHITSTKVWSKRFYRRENVIFFHQIRLRDRSWIILLVPRGL